MSRVFHAELATPLPPLRLADDTELPAQLVRLKDDPTERQLILFGELSKKGEIPRLTFHDIGGAAVFAGMLFRDAPKGSRAGVSMLKYFCRTMPEELGLQVGETSVIRKPLIALSLARCGFTAADADSRVCAGILPQGSIQSRCLDLHFIDGNETVFSDPRYRRFYRVISSRELPWLYPLENPSRPVDIHTSFTVS